MAIDKEKLLKFAEMSRAKKIALPDNYNRLSEKLKKLKGIQPIKAENGFSGEMIRSAGQERFQDGGVAEYDDPTDVLDPIIQDAADQLNQEDNTIIDSPNEQVGLENDLEPIGTLPDMTSPEIAKIKSEESPVDKIKESPLIPYEIPTIKMPTKETSSKETSTEEYLKNLEEQAASEKKTAAWADALTGIAANFSRGVLGQDMKATNFSAQAGKDAKEKIDRYLKLKQLEKAKEITPYQQAQLNLERDKLNLMKGRLASAESVKQEKPTMGQQMTDRQFAKDVYVPYVTEGGYADAKKGLDQLKSVTNELKSGKNLTGYFSTSWIPGTDASNYKERVREVIQRSLRPILGAQFTQKEGEALMDRAYNPLSSEKDNLKRLNSLIKQLESVADQKKRAAEYFEQNGTMSGFEGNIPDLVNIDPEASTISVEDKISNFMQKNNISSREEAIKILKEHGKI